MRARRGAAFLEFVLILPFIVGIMLLTLDVGRLVLAKSSLQDATSAAARAASRVGYAGFVPSQTCASAGSAADVAYQSFCAAAFGMPTGPIQGFSILEPAHQTALGATCSATVPNSQYVRVVGESDFNPLTPGLALLTGAANQGWGTMRVAATSVARCEVAR